jgi:hypothetical protein
LGCFLAQAGCKRNEPNFVNAKVFALDPAGYLGVTMAVRGRVVREGPGGAWFELEDETGKVLVSTERLSTRASCSAGSQAAAEGVLQRLSGDEGLYFSMENLIHCRP